MGQNRFFGFVNHLIALVIVLLGIAIVIVPLEWWGFSEDFAKLIGWRKVIVLGLLSFPAGYFLARGQRHLVLVGLNGRSNPFILWLRSFRDDDLKVARQGRDRYFWWMRMPADRLEEEIVAALQKYGDVVAIGAPGEQVPQLGCTRMYVEHEHWKSEVASLFEKSNAIVWVCGTSPGVQWEFDEAFARQVHDRFIAIVPPVSNTSERWTKLREWADARGVSLPESPSAPSAPVGLQGVTTEARISRNVPGTAQRLVYAARFQRESTAPVLYWGDSDDRGNYDTSRYPAIVAQAVQEILAHKQSQETCEEPC